MEDTYAMANQRKAGVERVTLTIHEDLLKAVEAEASKQGIDRLVVLREALKSYLGYKEPPQAKAAVSSGGKKAKKAAKAAKKAVKAVKKKAKAGGKKKK